MNISIILAAGEGSRMKSNTPKVLHKICGKNLLSYVIDACKDAKIDKNVVIVGHSKEKIIDSFEDDSIVFKEQPIGEDAPYGTGFAVMQGIDEVSDDSTVVILCGDTPLITSSTVDELISYHKNGSFQGTVLTATLDDATGYGRIVRKESGDILKIVEQKDASKGELSIKEVNSGIYCFNGGALKDALKKIDSNNAQNEYYLTDAISILNSEGYKVGAYNMENSIEIYGVNTRVQLAKCESEMKKRINNKLMLEGVTLIDPDNTYIEEDVIVGKDTIIYPGVVLEGKTTIGQDCILRGSTRIVDSQIGHGVEVESTVIEESTVDDNCKLGPFAHLRPNSKLGKNIKIGNFVEVKNSTLGDDTKAGHLAYIGDADLGRDVNVGCGVIFVNYNGKDKSRSTIDDNAFLGSNSNIVAPVHISKWGYVAAGSTIIEDVGEGDLSIARAKQVNKEGWVEKKGYKKYK